MSSIVLSGLHNPPLKENTAAYFTTLTQMYQNTSLVTN
uniref:Uncharacterized protein n=1 Tax=Anguilla anguilla TaxID=7936 RepID=A0A0E9SSD9_ANGAN